MKTVDSIIAEFQDALDNLKSQMEAKTKPMTPETALIVGNNAHDAAVTALGDLHCAGETTVSEHADAVDHTHSMIAWLKKIL